LNVDFNLIYSQYICVKNWVEQLKWYVRNVYIIMLQRTCDTIINIEIECDCLFCELYNLQILMQIWKIYRMLNVIISTFQYLKTYTLNYFHKWYNIKKYNILYNEIHLSLKLFIIYIVNYINYFIYIFIV